MPRGIPEGIRRLANTRFRQRPANAGVSIARLGAPHTRALHLLLSDGTIGRTLWDDEQPSLEDVIVGLERIERAREAGHLDVFAILDAKRTLVGLCRIDRDSDDERVGEIGYFVADPFQGRGYATAAMVLVLARTFWELSICQVVACCERRNARSRRVLHKLGFRRSDGPRERGQDVLTFELDVRDWLASSLDRGCRSRSLAWRSSSARMRNPGRCRRIGDGGLLGR